jgi:hypothetical protein
MRTAPGEMAPAAIASAGIGSPLELAPMESYVTARPSGSARPKPPSASLTASG